MKQKIGTVLGTVVIIIVAITVSFFVWRYESMVDAHEPGPDMASMN